MHLSVIPNYLERNFYFTIYLILKNIKTKFKYVVYIIFSDGLLEPVQQSLYADPYSKNRGSGKKCTPAAPT